MLIDRGIGSNSSPSTLNQDLPTGWRIISELLNAVLGSWYEDLIVLDHLKFKGSMI